MKPLLILASFVFAMFAADNSKTADGDLSGSDFAPRLAANTVLAKLRWQVSTNWTDEQFTTKTLLGWSGGGPDPNTTTHYQSGTVSSNLIAAVVWKGKTNEMVIESIHVRTLQRSYVEKSKRHYSDGTIE